MSWLLEQSAVVAPGLRTDGFVNYWVGKIICSRCSINQVFSVLGCNMSGELSWVLVSVSVAKMGLEISQELHDAHLGREGVPAGASAEVGQFPIGEEC